MPTFSDIPEDHPYYDAIEWMAELGITIGYPDGTYKSDRALSRGEMAVFLQRFDGAVPPPPDPDPELPPVDVTLNPGDDVWAAANNNPEGTVFGLTEGEYYVGDITPKTDQAFIGEGPDKTILTGQQAPGGALYSKVRAFNTAWPTATGAKNVRIAGMTIRHYMGQSNQSALVGGDGWIIEDVVAENNLYEGVQVGANATLRRVVARYNGQLGLKGDGSETGTIIVEDCETYENNTDDAHPYDWEAGGCKFLKYQGITVRNFTAKDNHGPGWWADWHNYNVDADGMIITGNKYAGLFHEVSGNAVYRNIQTEGNDRIFLIDSSPDVEIDNLVSRGDKSGIEMLARGEDNRPGAFPVSNMNVHDCILEYSAGWSGVMQLGNPTNDPYDDNNRFVNNIYNLAGWSGWEGPFRWGQGYIDMTTWNTLGHS